MGLLDDARVEMPPGPICGVRRVSAQLADPLLSEFLDGLGDHSITGRGLSRALKARNVRLSDQSITRHRKGECACP